MVETVGPLPFNRQDLYCGVLRCCCQAGAVIRTFLGGARLPATIDVIFCRRLEVIGSLFLVFEKVVFLNIGKKKNVWCFNGKKVGKMGGLLKTLRVL